MPKLVDTPRRITCVGCGLVAEGATDRLCVGCAEHPRGTRRHVGEQVDQYWQQERQAWSIMQTALEGVDDATQGRWYDLQDAIQAGDARATNTLDIIRVGMGNTPPKPVGVFADLIRLYLNWVDAFTAVSERRQWAARVEGALTELATPRIGPSPLVAGVQEIDKHQAVMEFVAPSAPRMGEYEVPPEAGIDYCHSCDQEIVWIKTPKGKAMPLSVKTIQRRNGSRFALSHFSDCEHGKQWKR